MGENTTNINSEDFSQKLSPIAIEVNADKYSNTSTSFDDMNMPRESPGDFNSHPKPRSKLTRKLLLVAYTTLIFTQLVESFAHDSTSSLNSYVVSSFNNHSLVSTAQTVYKITSVCAYPILGKITHVAGRGEGFGIAVFLYTLYYILMATCKNAASYLIGWVFFAIGEISFKIYLLIFIADSTNLINRGLWSQLPSAISGIITTYSGSYIQDAFLDHSTWRWAYGSFAIILGVFSVPLTMIMLYCNHIAKRLGERREIALFPNLPEGSRWFKIKHALLNEIDAIGLFFLLVGTTLFFIPFTITGKYKSHKWGDASTIVMITIGFIFLFVFILWCITAGKFSFLKERYPFIPLGALTDSTILISLALVAMDFCENSAFNVYISTTLQVGGYFTAGSASRVVNAKLISIDIASLLTGVAMKYTKRTKIFVLIGVPLLVLGHGLLVWFMNRDDVMEKDVLLYIMEIFIGVGRGIYTTSLQVTIQAIAGVQGIAMSTAVFLVFNSAGALVGAAIAGGIWNELLVNKLDKYLPKDDKKMANKIFQNIKIAMSYSRGTETRTAISLAYRETQQTIGWVTLGIIAPMLILMFFLREITLTDKKDVYGSDEDTISEKDEYIEKNRSFKNFRKF